MRRREEWKVRSSRHRVTNTHSSYTICTVMHCVLRASGQADCCYDYGAASTGDKSSLGDTDNHSRGGMAITYSTERLQLNREVSGRSSATVGTPHITGGNTHKETVPHARITAGELITVHWHSTHFIYYLCTVCMYVCT